MNLFSLITISGSFVTQTIVFSLLLIYFIMRRITQKDNSIWNYISIGLVCLIYGSFLLGFSFDNIEVKNQFYQIHVYALVLLVGIFILRSYNKYTKNKK